MMFEHLVFHLLLECEGCGSFSPVCSWVINSFHMEKTKTTLETTWGIKRNEVNCN